MKFSVVILARAAAKSKPCAAFICRKPAPDAAGAGLKIQNVLASSAALSIAALSEPSPSNPATSMPSAATQS